MLADINLAINQHLGQIISLSLGASELALQDNQRLLDQGHDLFQQAANEHITIVAADGDDGATNPHDRSYWNQPNVSWPASDPNVLAVSGTTLRLTTANDYKSETV